MAAFLHVPQPRSAKSGPTVSSIPISVIADTSPPTPNGKNSGDSATATAAAAASSGNLAAPVVRARLNSFLQDRRPSFGIAPRTPRMAVLAPTGDVHFVKGSRVFVAHPAEAWAAGEIVEVNEKQATVRAHDKQEYTVELEKVLPRTDDSNANDVSAAMVSARESIDNMIELDFLHEASMLQNVRLRFQMDFIYTYTGPILIAVNPYKIIRGIYASEMIQRYRRANVSQLPPHVFAVAERAYQTMMDTKNNGSVIISGESGSGKTEATKHVLMFLTAAAGAAGSGSTINQSILESGPLLEAFGNAKTVRNDNSSRFGKYLSVKFDSQGRIMGASVTNYLLEKSRVVGQSEGERSYHIFYQLCAGASAQMREKLRLQPVEMYRYLNTSGCFTIEGVDDAHDFSRTMSALQTIGFTPEQIDFLFRVIAGVMTLGNVEFKAVTADECTITNPNVLDTVSELLGLPPGGVESPLGQALCKRSRVLPGGEKIMSPQSSDQAVYARDALAKAIYSQVFDWLIRGVNNSIDVKPADQKKVATFIGVLDIFGFEVFELNSFEQLCINYANEKLMQHFNMHVFKFELQEYEREQIDASPPPSTTSTSPSSLLHSTSPNSPLPLFPGLARSASTNALLPNGMPLTPVQSPAADLLRKLAQQLGAADPEEVERHIAVLDANWYKTIDSLRGLTEERRREFCLPPPLFDKLKAVLGSGLVNDEDRRFSLAIESVLSKAGAAHVDMSDCRSDADADAISTLTMNERFVDNLRSVEFKECWKINDMAIKRLTDKCQNLLSINLTGCWNLGDASMRHLSRCPNLAHLVIDRCEDITDSAVAQLAQRCTGLVHFSCAACHKLTVETPRALVAHCPKLASLNLEQFSGDLVACLQVLKSAPCLTTLGLNLCAVTPDCMLHLRAETEDLSLSGLHVSDDVLAVVAMRCSTSLSRLVLSGCFSLTDASMTHSFPRLTELLMDGTDVTDDAVQKLKSRCPNLDYTVFPSGTVVGSPPQARRNVGNVEVIGLESIQ